MLLLVLDDLSPNDEGGGGHGNTSWSSLRRDWDKTKSPRLKGWGPPPPKTGETRRGWPGLAVKGLF